jgi:predicted nicotinamide N-methyase
MIGIGIPISHKRPPLSIDSSTRFLQEKGFAGPGGSAASGVSARRDFILANTARLAPPHVPEIALHLASEAHDLWLKTEDELAEIGLPPPFWAFAWAGGQGLARHVLDHPDLVAGRSVCDFASGSGLVAIAAVKAGAANVTAVDIDPFCEAAIALNAAANGATIRVARRDLIGHQIEADVLLAGDVFYDREFAARLTPWFDALAAAGTEIVVGDPGRAYLPKDRLEGLAVYEVPVSRALEDAEVKRTTVWRWRG